MIDRVGLNPYTRCCDYPKSIPTSPRAANLIGCLRFIPEYPHYKLAVRALRQLVSCGLHRDPHRYVYDHRYCQKLPLGTNRIMLSLVLTSLCLALCCSFATSVSVVQDDLDLTDVDGTMLPASLTWESGSNPAQYHIVCDANYGAGLDGRSCFSALSYSPSGTQQETWVSGLVPPGTPGTVRLPVVLYSGGCITLSSSSSSRNW